MTLPRLTNNSVARSKGQVERALQGVVRYATMSEIKQDSEKFHCQPRPSKTQGRATLTHHVLANVATKIPDHVLANVATKKSRRGISLLEVVLALAILAVASAYLAQSMHIAAENAARSESQTQAEIVAESIMNQIVAGVLPTQSVSWTAYSNPNPFGSSAAFTKDSVWMYSISSLSTEVQGMIGVQVAVNEVIDRQTDDAKADFYINRWIIDPSLGLDTPPSTESTDATATSSSSSSSTSTGSSTGGVQ